MLQASRGRTRSCPLVRAVRIMSLSHYPRVLGDQRVLCVLRTHKWQATFWARRLTSLHAPLGGKGWVSLTLAREGPHTGKAGGRWPSYGCVWNTHGRKADQTAERWTGYGTEGREGYCGAMGSLPRKCMETVQSKGTRARDVAQSPEFNSPALQKNWTWLDHHIYLQY